MNRPVTIVINTYNRCESLALTLQSLEWLDYDNFEVVVVNGPSTDGTDTLLAGMSDRVKVGRCENRNLSESRNIGIRMASGEIVAFIDDDAYPDPAWLNDLIPVFAWDEVAAAGGPVFAHTGYDLQVWYSRADRLGRFWTDFEPSPNPTQLLGFPGSQQFTYTIGTNSAFRRDRLVALGGFDEEFAYYLDETDLCCRFVDAGFVVAAQDRGFVYHKFLPSDIRERSDVVRDWYQILKSKFYFTLKHGVEAFSFAEVCDEQSTFVDQIRYNVLLNFEAGIHDQEVVDKFERDVRESSDRAFGLFGSGMVESSRTRPPSWFGHDPDGFLPFRTRMPEGRKLHLCFLCQEYPPAKVNGIGRVIHSLATGLAARGHVVRVLTMGEIQNRVDLEDGVWVHRMLPTAHDAPEEVVVPAHIWDYAASLLDELHRIDAMRTIDVVQGPNWDSEGIAVLLDGRFPYVVGLYTPLKTVAAMDPVMRGQVEDGALLIPQLIALETHVYEHADGYLACGPAIVEQIEADYGVTIPAERLGLVPHGLADQSAGRDDAAGNARSRLLFVGRLEARKGIDTMLQAAVRLSELGVDFELAVVGDDSLEGPGGSTYRAQFEREHPEQASRVRFLGRIDDDELRRHYQTCDVFVAPSRFESFGLILLEAMMFAKPVVAADIGGLAEIVEDGVTGFLVPPGEPDRLATTLRMLLESPELRQTIGAAGRAAFEERFTVERMSAGAETFYRVTARRREPAAAAV